MELVAPLIEPPCRSLWNCSAKHASYLFKLKENLISLNTSLNKLKSQREDVKNRIDIAEANPTEPMKHTHEVSDWLQEVEAIEREVEEILRQGSQHVNAAGNGLAGCFYRCLPKNCWTRYKLGKVVDRKLVHVEKLIEDGGGFNVVVEKSQPEPVHEMPIDKVVGVDSTFDKIWRWVTEDDPKRILGLYGMGGVGKTTLLKKLNNEFLKRDRHEFDLVLWVVVSNDFNLLKIQKDIARKLGFSLSEFEEKGEDERASDISTVLRRKHKFVLLLDDLWQRVDLQKIGIPALDNSKVVFTTREEHVCDSMKAKKINVECFNEEQSWSLFRKEVGEESLNFDPRVPDLAKKVAEECHGLPLALVTIARTMASKKTVEEWRHAVNVLKRSPAELSGMDDQVFLILKFSYDNLRTEKIKSCFLYCSLYPEDYSIRKEELIDHWIGEGFLDGHDDIEESLNEGHDVIGCLKSASLLSSGDDPETRVKMHDVIRDLAIWIASDCGKNKGKYLVVPKSKEPKLHEWEKAERLSLIDNYTTQELDEAPNCKDLLTLLLQGSHVRTISDDFFKFMPVLKVLNMSYMSNVRNYVQLPTSISRLVHLQYLNLSGLQIREPCLLKGLVELKYLNLSYSKISFRSGEIASLSNKLETLNLYQIRVDWEQYLDWEAAGGPSLSELEGLKHLNYLSITITTLGALRTLVSSRKLQLLTKSLSIQYLDELESLALSSSSVISPSTPKFISLADMVGLKELHLRHLKGLKELRISLVSAANQQEQQKINNLRSLETLEILVVGKLNIVLDNINQNVLPHHQSCFTSLQYVKINRCSGGFKDLTWLIYAPVLKTLALYELNDLEEIICDEFAPRAMVMDEKYYSDTVFSRLKTLNLYGCQNLKRICNEKHTLSFPCLEWISVTRCPKLKKLPLGTNSANNNTLKGIRGYTDWWDGLEWEDESIKSTFVSYFYWWDGLKWVSNNYY